MAELRCKRCGYRWRPRKGKPKECPNCKSRFWDADKEKE